MLFPFLHPNAGFGQKLVLIPQELNAAGDLYARPIDPGGESEKISKLVRCLALQLCFFSKSVWYLSHWEVPAVAASLIPDENLCSREMFGIRY